MSGNLQETDFNFDFLGVQLYANPSQTSMDETVDKVEITMRTVYTIDTSDRWILVAMPYGVLHLLPCDTSFYGRGHR